MFIVVLRKMPRKENGLGSDGRMVQESERLTPRLSASWVLQDLDTVLNGTLNGAGPWPRKEKATQKATGKPANLP